MDQRTTAQHKKHRVHVWYYLLQAASISGKTLVKGNRVTFSFKKKKKNEDMGARVKGAKRATKAGEEAPLMFFQFEMQGGIFQLAISAAVTLRGGECITGTGGEGGPFGTFL